MKKRQFAGLFALALAALVTPSAQAVWMEQTIPLVAGWNAIHVKVNPYAYACDEVFGGGVVDKVSWWNFDRRDDGTGTVSSDSYLWDANNPEGCTFNAVLGGECYLVHANAATNLTVFGTPAIPRGKIHLGKANLAGLWIPNGGAASVSTYFGSPEWLALDGCYCVTADNESLVMRSNTAISNASQAFWLNTVGTGTITYTGPLELSVDTSDGIISWRTSSAAHAITVKNVSDIERTVTFSLEASLPPPEGEGTFAGDIQLLQETTDWSQGYARKQYAAATFPYATNLAAGASFTFKVRPNFSALSPSSGYYLGILKISDAGSPALPMPGPRTYGVCEHRVGLKASGSLVTTPDPTGLWVGSVALTLVNRAQMLSSAASEWNAEALQEAQQAFEFPLILHAGNDGAVKLLKQVFVGTCEDDNETAALLPDRAMAKLYRAAHPSGKIRRVSSANFPFMDPLAFGGATNFLHEGGVLTATFTQGSTARDNPFLHRFHPNHDHLTFNNGKPSQKQDSTDGTGDYESWSVTRKVTLTFSGTDPTSAADLDWNRTVCGGTYREEITGLNKTPIIVEGSFRLNKALETPELSSGSVVP